MPRSLLLILVFTVLFPILAFAETDSLPSGYFSLGPKKAGIGLGDAPVYTGFKFNLLNKHTRRVNIFDLCVIGDSEDGTINGTSFGIIANFTKRINGISIAGIMNAVDEENGVMIGPVVGAGKLNGIGIGGVMGGDTYNGLTIAVFRLMSATAGMHRDSMEVKVNGMAICVSGSDVNAFKGVAIGAYNNSYVHKGLAIGGVNKTGKLKGVQLGLYNVAMNNPKGFRRLPLINMHLGK